MKVKTATVMISIINVVLLHENNDEQTSLFMKILEKRSKFFYTTNYKIHSLTNILFSKLKLNKNIEKSSNFQSLLKTHLYFNNKAQTYYNVYDRLKNASYSNPSRASYKNLDHTIHNIVKEKFDKVKNGLNILLPDFINASAKLYFNENETEVTIQYNNLKGLSDKINQYIIDPTEKDKTSMNDTNSISENISQDLNALRKIIKNLRRFDTQSQKDVVTYEELKTKINALDIYHKNNLTHALENIIKDEIDILKNNITNITNMTQTQRKTIFDLWTENKTEVTNVSDKETVVFNDHIIKNMIDQIIHDVKPSDDTDHTFDNLILSADEIHSNMFRTNASIGARIETRRIYKGKKTRVKNYPFLASLHLASEFLCAGSIISVDLVLTAASCLQIAQKNEAFRKDPRTIFARVGSDFTKHSGKLMPIVEVIFHPNYDPITLKNNLAIAKILKKLKHTKERKIKIIKYDRDADVLKNNVHAIKILGWGARDEKEKVIGVQRPSVAHLDIYDINDCKEIYSKYYVTEKNFCAGFTNKGGGACMGDVGGPAIVSKKLVGVVSFGPTVCGLPDAPTVFTKVGFYADWINDVIHKNEVNKAMENPETTNNPSQPELAMITESTIRSQDYNSKKSQRENPEKNEDENPDTIQGDNPYRNHGKNPAMSQSANFKKNQDKNTVNNQDENPEEYVNLVLQKDQKLIPIANSKSSRKPVLRKVPELNIKHTISTASHKIPLLRPRQKPVSLTNSQLRLKQRLVANGEPEIKQGLNKITYRKPQMKQDQKSIFPNNFHNISDHVKEKVSDDQITIIKQLLQDFILNNDTVIDYLTNGNILDDVNMLDNKSENNDIMLSEPKKLNQYLDLVSRQKFSEPSLRIALSKSTFQSSTTSILENTATNAHKYESYYDGKPTQIGPFVKSVEFSNDDVSSYYEVEIPIEDTPFKEIPPAAIKDEEYNIGQYRDSTRNALSNILHATTDKYDSHENETPLQDNQNYKSLSPRPIFNKSLNVYHTHTDKEIDEKNYDVRILLKDVTDENTGRKPSTDRPMNFNTKETRFQIVIGSKHNDESFENEQKDADLSLGAAVGSISQEDFNYVNDDKQEMDMRARDIDDYYDFYFVLDDK